MEKRICNKCSEPKPMLEFAKHTLSTGGRRHVCKKCCSDATKARAEVNQSNGLCACGRPPLPDRRLCEKCTARLSRRQLSNRGKGLCRCGKLPIEGVTCEGCKGRSKDWAHQLKEETMQAYGGRCQCSCGCTESKLEFLTLDHERGGGRQHRESLGTEGSGAAFYSYLKKNRFPQDGLRAMCWNCNCARGMYGYCPNEKEKKD